jgi:hypothetical protein
MSTGDILERLRNEQVEAAIRPEKGAGRRQAMEWMERNQNFGRLVALALFLAAMIGPWAFNSDGVPPPEWCAAPNYLLKSGFCARQVSGVEIFVFMLALIPSEIAWLATGDAFQPERMREFGRLLLLTALLIMLVAPLLTTVLKIWGRDTRLLRRFHLGTWAAAAGLSLLPIWLEAELRSGRYWGIWLYFGMACGMVMLEAVLLMRSKKGRPA